MANVLIQGAGIAGCALAAMLRKQGNAVTVSSVRLRHARAVRPSTFEERR
jgi:2-polyprenyl-6-methoxyphenol hydroxylase-like FAD-dependent oxidoreductase